MADVNEWDFIFTWRIEDFSLLNMEIDNRLFTPYFKVKALEDRRWFLAFEMECSSEKFYFYLGYSGDRCSEAISFSCKIEVMNESKKILAIFIDDGPFKNKFSKAFMVESEKFLSELKSCGSDTVTIHCHMKRTDETKRLAQKGEIRTRISTERSCFDWRLQLNKSSMTVDGTRYFCLRDIIYSLKVPFSQDDMIIKVGKVSESSSFFHCFSGKITLLNIKRHIAFTTESFFHSGYEFHDFPSIITKEQLQDKLNELVIDGEIVLRCEFFVKLEEKTHALSTSADIFTCSKSVLDMCKDFRNIFSNENLSDVALRAGNKVIKAHRLVLAARSPVFSAMFEHDMLESKTGIVNIDDVDANILESFLRFLYTGETDDLDPEMACKLFLVSDKYRVPSLKAECLQFLITSISVVSVCKLLEIADIEQHEILKRCCLDFIAAHSVDIYSSHDWIQLVKDDPKLSSEVILYIGQHYAVEPLTKER